MYRMMRDPTLDFIDSCITMGMEWGWSIEDILEMPSSRWFVIQERLPHIQKKMQRRMKHGRLRK